MKLILDNGKVYEFRDWDVMVLDNALVAFNAAKEYVSYFDEETRQGVYASYERLRSVVPFLGNDKGEPKPLEWEIEQETEPSGYTFTMARCPRCGEEAPVNDCNGKPILSKFCPECGQKLKIKE